MSTAFTILALCVVAYRIKARLFTKAEAVLLALWLGHYAFELVTMYGERMCLRYEARFLRPAEFLTWFWLAWGVVKLWQANRLVQKILVTALSLVIVYDLVLLARANIPLGRRNAYASACEWAAEKIKADWKGPSRDERHVFTFDEYRTPYRPIIDCHSARVAYLVGGRSNGMDDGMSKADLYLDTADYWIQDLRTDEPPQPANAWQLMGTFKRGKYELPLYRRIKR